VVRLNIPRQVIWAVDAFESASNPLLKMSADWIAGLIRELGTRVEPVYVLSPAELNLTGEFGVPWVARYRPYAEQALSELMRTLAIPGLVRERVLTQDSEFISHAIDSLSDYALATGADAIIASTHARSGMKRLLLGSFVESLILKSLVPVLVVGAAMHRPRPSPLNHLLVPTELNDDAKEFYAEVIRLARGLDARVTLLHATSRPIEPVISSGVYLLGGGWILTDSYFTEAARLSERRMQAWVRWGKGQGVRVDGIVEHVGTGTARKLTAFAAENTVDAIVMEAQSGPWASALIGSVTRQVVRSSPCPVWVIGPKARASILRAAA
jgi:nucleotide-binding universal stress UspA family protein